MNTKTFAQKSRKLLMDGVAKQILFWGFDTKGEVIEEPQGVAGGYSFRGKVYDDAGVPALWRKLRYAISKKGIEHVVEEAAYTWFNRIMALRIMAKNGYEDSQLEYAEGMEHTPVILQGARQGQCDYLNAVEKTRLKKLIGDYNKDQESFALLLVGYCHSNNMLNNVFGKLDDYTELLLPSNMLQENSFLHLLNTTDAISDDDYQKVELIGWLYQFYISERKDEIFASFKKNKKAEAKDIPAATQIFTPNWIVKYMVENTAGKIWLDKHPDSPLKGYMKYLVENESDTTVLQESKTDTERSRSAIISNIEELTLIDSACGSGHILVEGFDLLYQMYMEEYYEPEEAVESILKNNLFGLDIDERAAQLATFAILLKAAKRYRNVFAKAWMPNVYAMPEAQDFTQQAVKDFLGVEGEEYTDELEVALSLMQQAKNLGSIMKLSLNNDAHTFIKSRFYELQQAGFHDLNVVAAFQSIKTDIPVLLILTQKYASVVANPPYMGQKNMNADLKNYVSKNYPISKSDLFAVFMECTLAMCSKNGLMGMINQHSWMFLSSYENLRTNILNNYSIVNMVHLGPRTFEELSGEVVQSTAFVLKNANDIDEATYYRLVDYKNIHEKETQFLNGNNKYSNISQTNFSKIPGSPIGYWVSDNIIELFKTDNIGDSCFSSPGVRTGKDAIFIRNWFEINKKLFAIKSTEYNDIEDDVLKWYPLTRGGEFRKWYGNYENVINLQNGAKEIKIKCHDHRLRDSNYYFKEGITWTMISSYKSSFRYVPQGILYGNGGPVVFSENNFVLLALLNSIVSDILIKLINPTLNITKSDVEKLPLPVGNKRIDSITKSCILSSQRQYSSYEFSWEFEKFPLLNGNHSLQYAYQAWQEQVTQDFFQLHTNEEELNRIFIDIYGLQDELTPDVALKDITILQDELAKKDLEALEVTFREKGKEAIELPINKAEVISQFISYAIGLFMGRYRLDKAGLNIAHPNPSTEELESYTYNGGHVTIDEDAILPLMGNKCNFPDDVFQQINSLLDTLWGHDTRTENINFIQECLNKDLDKFLIKDFYKYHCRMYKKKPIYWLFSSQKGTFQVLVYMHRMNEFTAEKIRANYLLPHINNLQSEEVTLKANESTLSTQDAKRLEQLRKDIIECEAYDMELKNVADQQIKFDLDDGVSVNYKLFEKVVAKIK